MGAGNHILSGFEFLQVGLKASALQYGGELSRDVNGTIKPLPATEERLNRLSSPFNSDVTGLRLFPFHDTIAPGLLCRKHYSNVLSLVTNLIFTIIPRDRYYYPLCSTGGA